jgi:two-component system, cell cycle sensor histidine kinase and response regulator CckA
MQSQEDEMDQTIKLLIVDDEQLIRLNLRAMLEDLGYLVIEASNGQEGLDAFDLERPDLVLADLRMPVMDGRAMIAKLYDKSPETPVIVISGTGTVRDAIDALRLGAWDYIAKPVDVLDSDGLDIIIKRAIDKARLIRENRLYREQLEELVRERTKELYESENRYRRLLESVTSYVYTVAIKKDIPTLTVHSPGCMAVTGFSPEEYIADPDLWLKMVHEDDRPLLLEMSRRILNEKFSISFEYRINHKEGSVRWVNNTLVPHRNAGAQLLSYDGIVVDITDRKLAESALRESEAKMRSILDNAGIGVTLISPKMEVLESNKRMKEWFPVMDTAQPHICYRVFNKPPRETACENCPASKTLQDGSVHEAMIERHLGSITGHYRIVSSPIFNGKGAIIAAIELVEDITERLSMEAQVRQSQKMESIGRLAGGVAHDFNNMLSVIIGYTEMAMEHTEPSQPLFSKLQEIWKAAIRSSDLTRQLLAFARKQNISPKVLDLNQTVEGMLKMLRRLIGEDINLSWQPGPGVWPIKIDPSQIDQILANLCVNARDAITGVGRIIIETQTIMLDKPYCDLHQEIVPGDYVLLTVSDDGCGMDKATLDRLFEPFFTTKESGKGTGLGLATVYGIVKQNNGAINVYSEPGRGTTFKIFLPRHEANVDEDIPRKSLSTPVSIGHENILLVEDEPSILEMGKMMLEKLGYRVLTATMPGDAICMAKENASEIHLLITDVIMPKMNGLDLAKNIISICPGLKYLFISGYTSSVIAHHGILDNGVNFLQKPFSIQTLASKVREVLGSK